MNMVQRKIEFDSIFVGLGWFLVILIRYCYDNLFFLFRRPGGIVSDQFGGAEDPKRHGTGATRIAVGGAEVRVRERSERGFVP